MTGGSSFGTRLGIRAIAVTIRADPILGRGVPNRGSLIPIQSHGTRIRGIRIGEQLGDPRRNRLRLQHPP